MFFSKREFHWGCIFSVKLWLIRKNIVLKEINEVHKAKRIMLSLLYYIWEKSNQKHVEYTQQINNKSF